MLKWRTLCGGEGRRQGKLNHLFVRLLVWAVAVTGGPVSVRVTSDISGLQ